MLMLTLKVETEKKERRRERVKSSDMRNTRKGSLAWIGKKGKARQGEKKQDEVGGDNTRKNFQ
jgi:hypothetical protein